MRRLGFDRNFAIATALVIAVIVYGSLYPFEFRQPIGGLEPAALALLRSWRETPSRGDFIANVALYTPLGFFAFLAIGKGVDAPKRIAVTILTGALLSACMELVQYFDDGRETAATDLYANVVGTGVGAIGGSLTGRNLRWPIVREIAANRVPALLLVAWVGYRLFPYVPTTDLHKYWKALQPVIVHASLNGYDLFRYTAIWLTIGALIEAISGPKRARLLFPLFVGSVLVAKVAIVYTTLTMAEIAGAGLALCAWGLLAVNARLRISVVTLLFCGYVIAERLEPFQFGGTAGSFGWVPFWGFMSGSEEMGVLSFLQKFFLFGGTIWLLGRTGLRLSSSIVLTASILFVTSCAEIYLPNRSAEITDAVMAVIIGSIFALIGTDSRRTNAPPKEHEQAAHRALSRGEGVAPSSVDESRTVEPSPVNDGEHGLAPRASIEAAFRKSDHGDRRTLARLLTATICLGLVAAIAVNYPLAPWALGIVLVVYAAALWRWPSLWLAVVPAMLPAFDLTPWTGWTQVGEPDLFVLVTLAILALRAPPHRADFRLEGLAAVAVVLTSISYLLSGALGLALPGPEGGSDNVYLRPDNALHLAKGFFTALALLPFLRARMRTHGDAIVWLGRGMAAGLALVAAAVLVERALFPGIFDFTTDYRVVGTFSGMNIGGGYLGAYLAMALPFLMVFVLRPSPLALLAMFGIAIGAGYSLVVTFARTAYAAALLSMLTAGLGWVLTGRHRRMGTVQALALPVLVLMLVGGIVVGAFGGGFMAERLGRIVPDFADREGNWTGGLALRDGSLATALFGMGYGTYPRLLLARKPDEEFPTNFVVARDGGYRFLSLGTGSPTYFGQKVPVQPAQQYRLFVTMRSADGKGALGLSLCEKMLLYSANCRETTFRSSIPGEWEEFGALISSRGIGEDTILGWLKRPVELVFFNIVPGTSIEVEQVRMFDPLDHDIIVNGNFARGTERWYFTDDEHRLWRILNQYLMSWFEGGALGLACFILLAGTALAGAARAIGRGERMGAVIIGSLVAFLCSSAFDHLLAVPRLAVLFYLVSFSGLTMMRAPTRSPAEPAISRDRSGFRSDPPARPG